MRLNRSLALFACAYAVLYSAAAYADAITDWNARTSDLIAEAKMGTPPAVRLMALTQTAAHEALKVPAAKGDPDAAVAAAHRAVLSKVLPDMSTQIERLFDDALKGTVETPSRRPAIVAGEGAASAVLAERLKDGAGQAESYRPYAAAGAYVPTSPVAVPQWPLRKPWLMREASQFRPAPPPSLASDQWARDFEEVKRMGARQTAARGADETVRAKFWEYSLPAIYFGVVRSVADQPGRDIARNARLYAAVAQAMDDALIAVFDAKYHYGFWRPVTAIRNADLDPNGATERDAGWHSLIEAPLHPEYPSGHSILASTVARVLDAEYSGRSLPVLSTTSPTAAGVRPTWPSTDAFVKDVSLARIHAGIHFRFSTEVAEKMGARVARLAIEKYIAPAQVSAVDLPLSSH